AALIETALTMMRNESRRFMRVLLHRRRRTPRSFLSLALRGGGRPCPPSPRASAALLRGGGRPRPPRPRASAALLRGGGRPRPPTPRASAACAAPGGRGRPPPRKAF